MDRGAQKATVLGVTKSWTQLSMHAYTKLFRHYPKGSGKPLKHISKRELESEITFMETHPGCSVDWEGARAEWQTKQVHCWVIQAGISGTGDMKRIGQNLEAESRGLGRGLKCTG